jgi:2-amino-4-hydroxy-6-hydroxymethyldihydropteridine diphosphokinase
VARVYLGLGSNIDAEKNLRLGLRELQRRFGDLRISKTYRNAAVGFEGEDFLNLAVELESDATPDDIHAQIEDIHEIVGRRRGSDRYSSRPLDIDLLLYGDMVLGGTPLRLPRPDVLEYSFVLKPLSELAPDLVHPETGKTLYEHWQEFDVASHPLTPVDVIL